jgi:hypothetical protein
MTNAAQCLLGCTLGARFQPDFVRDRASLRRRGGRDRAVVDRRVGRVRHCPRVAREPASATLVLGMAPGGIAEMCITAKVLQLGVPLITAFHVTRVVVLCSSRRRSSRGRASGGNAQIGQATRPLDARLRRTRWSC